MLRPLRALRVVRILRLGAVAGVAQRRATRSLHAQVTTYVFSAVIVALVVAGIAVREAERGSPDANIANVWDGIWWAVTTVTTVGYGDYYPTTPLGRLIAVGLMLIGIALIGVVTGSIATWFVEKLEGTEEAVDAAIEEAGAVTDAKLAEVLVELREVRRLLEEGRSVAGSSG